MLKLKNSKLNIFFLSLVLFIYSCAPIKKALPIQEALEKKDTVQAVIIKPNEPKIDSTILIKETLQKIWDKRIDYKTFNAKVKTDYYGQEQSQNFTAYVSIKKDSIIYLQMKGFLGVVGLQAKITKDSVIMVYKLEKKIEKRTVNYLQELTQIPFDFYTIQDLIIGNPVFTSNNLASYKQSNGQLLALVIGDIFKHLVTINESDLILTHSKLDDKDPLRNRTCDITYNNYINKSGVNFSTYRNISVAEKAKLDINLEFKEYTFNEPLKYMFSIPKNYKIK